MKDSIELARLCTLDIGKEVTPDEVRRYLLAGVSVLSRFSREEQKEIEATLFKELLAPR